MFVRTLRNSAKFMSICINRKKLIFFIRVYMIIYNFKRFINLKRTNFHVHLFLRAKKELYFASVYLGKWQIFENFASTCLCEWQVFENFEFINFSPKEKRIRKKQLNQGTFG